MLSGDLGPCPENGLVVTGNAELDCGNRLIRGMGQPADGSPSPETTGILLRKAKGAVVRNCRVSGFRTGIELRETEASTVAGATVFDNGDFRSRVGYGVHLNRSVQNTIRDSTIRANADEGVHVGHGSNDNVLLSNEAYDNGRENFYVLSAQGTQISKNSLGGKVSAALYMKHATLSRVEANQVKDRPVVIRGNSSGNVFVDNDLEGGLVVSSYVDKRETARPTANLFRGGRISGSQVCLSFTETTGNRIEGAQIAPPCRRIAAHSAVLTTNLFVGVSMERIRLDLSGGANLRLLGPVRVTAVDVDGVPVANAQLTIRDKMGETNDGVRTDASGIADLIVPTHLVNAAGLVALSPVAVQLRADGFLPVDSVLDEPLPPDLKLTLEPAR
jgi:parallel beta-helix repeat protein